jgi:2-C-methyl-D-erythritol 4-phosphate cytidylyltransferase
MQHIFLILFLIIIMTRYAIIVAGGSGSRMGLDTPKQFLLLRGKPLLMHSIERFSGHCEKVIAVLPKDRMEDWKTLCQEYNFSIRHDAVPGGGMRAESVKCGLDLLEGDGIAAIHDAARPLITDKLITRLFTAAEQEGSAVPVIKIGDSLRKMIGNSSVAVDRSEYRLVQTPQCFDLHLIRKAFLHSGFRNFTDEASMAEAAGYTMHLIEGEVSNIKITVPADLVYAESLQV